MISRCRTCGGRTGSSETYGMVTDNILKGIEGNGFLKNKIANAIKRKEILIGDDTQVIRCISLQE